MSACHTHDALSDDARVRRAWAALEAVRDPEIPPVSVVDLGVIAAVRVEGGSLVVEMTPTFVGCPAVELMRQEIIRVLAEQGEEHTAVRLVFDPPWTSERITPAGREKLLAFGLAPPGTRPAAGEELVQLEVVRCPYCGSLDTALESIFGPTLCRSIHYCRACRQSFEHFKPV